MAYPSDYETKLLVTPPGEIEANCYKQLKACQCHNITIGMYAEDEFISNKPIFGERRAWCFSTHSTLRSDFVRRGMWFALGGSSPCQKTL